VIATNVTTNHGREFVYAQRVVSTSDGTYEFIVPYSTEGPLEGGTNFDVLASPYTIRAGHIEDESWILEIEKEVRVNERAVLEGESIRVDL
jgi:dolichyl-diphosphooligosaccharide--protein glycosyltransferase